MPTGRPGRPHAALPQLSHRRRAAPSSGRPPRPAAWHLPPALPQAYPGLGLQEHMALHVLAGLAVGHSSLPHSIFAGIQRGKDVGTGSLASGLAAAVRGPRAACPPVWPRPRAATEGGALSTARKGGRALNGGHPGKKAATWLGPAVGPGEGCSPVAQSMAEWWLPPIPAFPAPALSHLSAPKAKFPHAGPPRGTKEMSPTSSTSSSRQMLTSQMPTHTQQETHSEPGLITRWPAGRQLCAQLRWSLCGWQDTPRSPT